MCAEIFTSITETIGGNWEAVIAAYESIYGDEFVEKFN